MFLRAKASRVIFTLLTCSLVLMSEVVRASNITLQGSFTLRDQRRSSFHQSIKSNPRQKCPAIRNRVRLVGYSRSIDLSLHELL
jgi:hypothetical protein